LKQLVAAERSGQPFLCFRDPGGHLSLHLLPGELGRCTLGRRATADITIPWDAEVSGLHAELEWLGGEWTILDDGLSTNGTFVNEQRIHGRRRLRGGERLRVGRTVIAFTDGTPSPVPKTAGASERPSIELTPAQLRVADALCGPCIAGGAFAAPASNQEIADLLFLSVDAVKMHLRGLFSKFELDVVPQNQKRAKLAEILIHFGFVSQAP
jgi:hypothetical protein